MNFTLTALINFLPVLGLSALTMVILLLPSKYFTPSVPDYDEDVRF